jgi:hypothetical protein
MLGFYLDERLLALLFCGLFSSASGGFFRLTACGFFGLAASLLLLALHLPLAFRRFALSPFHGLTLSAFSGFLGGAHGGFLLGALHGLTLGAFGGFALAFGGFLGGTHGGFLLGALHGFTLGAFGGFLGGAHGGFLLLSLLFHLLLTFRCFLLGLHGGLLCLTSAAFLHLRFISRGFIPCLHGLGLPLFEQCCCLLLGGHGCLLLAFSGLSLGLFGRHFLLMTSELHLPGAGFLGQLFLERLFHLLPLAFHPGLHFPPPLILPFLFGGPGLLGFHGGLAVCEFLLETGGFLLASLHGGGFFGRRVRFGRKGR